MILYLIFCMLTLLAAYLINMTYLSVFYHRGFTHQAIILRPWLKKFVVRSGAWMTGLDPKSWTCMHRMHHLYSDLPSDPHSPVNVGVVGVLKSQYHSYNRTMAALIQNRKKYTSLVQDLDFPVNWLNRKGLWSVPYLIHGGLAVSVGWYFDAWLLGTCYFVGLMSHPLQGWLVNSLGHRFGYRNFNTADNSRNNILVSWFALGEGYQNNHHQAPQSAKFGIKWWEIDFGYQICRILGLFRLVEIRLSTVTGRV
jgi:stearoyl-CoA desaturase (delta-9 desaturase)